MSDQGWIKLYRKIQSSFVWTNSDQLKLWLLILMKANHSQNKFLFNGQEVSVNSGQFVTGRDAIASEFNKGVLREQQISGLKAWRWLKKFEKLGMLNIQSNARYSVISVSKWDEYQVDEHPVNTQRTSNEHPMNTNKNEKNDKKKHSRVSAEIPYAEIVEYLNEKTGKHFTKSAAATKSKINARWHEGRRLTDFKTVIDVKSAEWNGTDAAKWLRPETLFGTKFEAYLNEQPTVKPTSIPTREDLTERTERIRSFVLNRHIDGMDNTSIKQILAEGGADVSLDTIQKIINKGDMNGS